MCVYAYAQITKRRLAYFGPVVRTGGLDCDVMLGMGGGSRSRSRPRKHLLQGATEVSGGSLTVLWNWRETETGEGV